MASITKHISLGVDAATAWAAIRDVGRPHLVFRGVLTDARIDGDDRVVTFANGMVVRERIIDLDDAARRLAYSVVDGPFTHHHATFSVTAEPDGTSRLTWVADLLPDEVAPMVEDLMDQGASAAAASLGG
jgi:Polyketide cyclase / dehydrase and lipid transport